jgi:hypothetical protein
LAQKSGKPGTYMLALMRVCKASEWWQIKIVNKLLSMTTRHRRCKSGHCTYACIERALQNYPHVSFVLISDLCSITSGNWKPSDCYVSASLCLSSNAF